MRSAIHRLVVSVLLMWAATACAQAATYYVAQEAANASDENPGTEQEPWSTLSKAAATAQKGDTVCVKAGTYREELNLNNDGVAVQAFGDDKVVLTRPAGQLIEPTQWRLVPDRQQVYECDAPGEGKILVVDERAIYFEKTRGVKVTQIFDYGAGRTERREVDRRLEDDDVMRWTATPEGKIQLDLGGEGPGKHRVELIDSSGPGGVRIQANECRVRGLQVRDVGSGIAIAGERNVVEDCLVQECWEGGVSIKGAFNTLRRSAVIDCGGGVNTGDCLGVHLVEQNLIVGSGRWLPARQAPQDPGFGLGIRIGNTSNIITRQNVVADSRMWAWWPDVICHGLQTYENVMWRNWHGGFYNEAIVNGTRLLYNASVRNATYGACYRSASMVVAEYNYVAENGMCGFAFHSTTLRPIPWDNILRNNLIQKHSLALLWDGGIKPFAQYQVRRNFHDDNIYTVEPGGEFAVIGGTGYGLDEGEQPQYFHTVKEFSEATGLERRSVMREGSMEEFGLGLVTFRVPFSEYPDEAVPMVFCPISRGIHLDPMPYFDDDVLFYEFGDADDIPRITDFRSQVFGYLPFWSQPVDRKVELAPEAIPCKPLPSDGSQPFWVETRNAQPEKMPKGGIGWWGASLPTIPGARIRVSLRVSGEELEGVSGPPVLAFLRFSSLTDQHVSRQYLIGGDVGEAPTGTFGWKDFGPEFVAPPEAYRFALFFGVKPCTGKAKFAQIAIDTDPVAPEPETSLPKEVRWEPLDLKGFFNHDLDKDVTRAPGTEKEAGWPPAIDMSKWEHGRQVFGGVPFVLDRAIVLRNSMRPSKELPREVRGIPVGHKVAGLEFLHACRFGTNGREQFRYVLNLEDGSAVQLPVVGGHDVWYWGDPAPGLRPWRQENNARTDLARGRTGVDKDLLYRMEWVNPRPDVAVESIDFMGADTGEPALLAITAVLDQ